MTPQENVRELLHAAVDDIDPSPDGLQDLRARIAAIPPDVSRKPRWLAAAAVLLLVASVGAIVVTSRGEEPSRVTTGPSPSTTELVAETTTTAVPSTTTVDTTGTSAPASSSTTTTTTAAAAPVRGTWRRMAEAPSAARGAPLWTGSELVVWSGGNPASAESRGAAYRPDLDRWREFDSGPLEPRTGHSAVWTGREIVYWGGRGAGKTFSDGAAFDPAGGSWRLIAPAPIGARAAHIAVWTGKEVVVWGGYDQCCPADTTIHDPAAAAYDPATDTWRRLVDVPEPWSGYGGLAVAVAHEGDVFVWRGGRFGRFDTRANEWRDLGGPERRTGRASNCGSSNGLAVVGALAGGNFLVWYGGCWLESGAALDLARGSWADLAEPPAIQRVAATGNHVLGLVGSSAVVRFDAASGTWSAPNRGPERPGSGATAIWTGSELLVWGGSDGSGWRRDGLAFRPSGVP